MPHHVSLSRIVVGGSFACAVLLTIASSLAQVALGASEIVHASPGGKIAAGSRLTLHVAHVGAFSVINASAPPPDFAATCIGTILSPPLSILSTPGSGAFPLSCSPPHFGSASVTQPFVSSNAGGYSDDRDALRFAVFLCVIMTVSISSSYCSIQRLLFITAAFVIIPVLSTQWSFESFVSVRALEPLFFYLPNRRYKLCFFVQNDNFNRLFYTSYGMQ